MNHSVFVPKKLDDTISGTKGWRVLKGYLNYNIHYTGKIYSLISRSLVLPNEKDGNLYISLTSNGLESEYLLSDLMLRNYSPKDYVFGMAIIFKDKNQLNCRLSNLRFIPDLRRIYRFDQMPDEKEVSLWKCDQKANSANYRAETRGIVDKYDVFRILRMNGFKCFYCQDNLDNKTWELDHYEPIVRGGKNIITNLVCSCRYCNRLKGEMTYTQMITKVYEILKHHQSLSFYSKEA